jgi:hypothetical protein
MYRLSKTRPIRSGLDRISPCCAGMTGSLPSDGMHKYCTVEVDTLLRKEKHKEKALSAGLCILYRSRIPKLPTLPVLARYSGNLRSLTTKPEAIWI